MKKNSKERLFEVMARVAPDFINESEDKLTTKPPEAAWGSRVVSKNPFIVKETNLASAPVAPTNTGMFKPKNVNEDSQNIYNNKYGDLTIKSPIIPDAIQILSKNKNAIKFTNKNEFDNLANKEKYFSASQSHCFYTPNEHQEWLNNGNKYSDSDSENSKIVFDTGHRLVQVWDNKNNIGYIVPADKSKDVNETPDDPETTETENNEFFNINMPINSEDAKLFTDIINQGIDSHLEGFTKSKFNIKEDSRGKRLNLDFHKSELPILLRRLEELGNDEALSWKDDIEHYDQNIDEITKQVHPMTSKQGLHLEQINNMKIEDVINNLNNLNFDPDNIPPQYLNSKWNNRLSYDTENNMWVDNDNMDFNNLGDLDLDDDDIDNVDNIQEISRELVNKTADAMKLKGQEQRSDRIRSDFNKKYFQEFIKKPIFKFNDEMIYGINYDKSGDNEMLRISIGSGAAKEYNRSYGYIFYHIPEDKYDIPNPITREDARLLSLIAMKVNPETKYKNGTGDFKIKGY
jgi:hypothetical protein